MQLKEGHNTAIKGRQLQSAASGLLDAVSVFGRTGLYLSLVWGRVGRCGHFLFKNTSSWRCAPSGLITGIALLLMASLPAGAWTGRVVYGEGTQTTPRYQTWDGSGYAVHQHC